MATQELTKRNTSHSEATLLALTGLLVLLTWLAGGTPPRVAATYGAFLVVTVVLPGIALHQHLFGRGSLLRATALGAPLGYVLQVGLGVLGTAIGAQWVVWVPVLLVLGRRGATGPRPVEPVRPPLWSTLAGLTAVMVAVLLPVYVQTPLPIPEAGVRYFPDFVFFHSIAAELKHHAVPQMPWVSGVDLRYHWFLFEHLAMSSVSTGVELEWLVHRLHLPPLLALSGLQVGWIAIRHSGIAQAAPLGIVLVLLAGEADILLDVNQPFLGMFTLALGTSGTLLFGLVIFLPLLAHLWDFLGRDQGLRMREWAGIGLLMVGLAGAKGSALPTIVGGLCLLTLWNALGRRTWRRAAGLATMASAVFLGMYALLYAGGDVGARLDPLRTISRATAWDLFLAPTSTGVLGILLSLAAATALLVALLAPILGLAALRSLGAPAFVPRTDAGRLAFAMGGVAIAGFLVLDQPGASQVFVLHFGIAGAVLWLVCGTAERLRELGGVVPRGVLATFLVTTTALALATRHWVRADRLADRTAYRLGHVLFALLVVVVVIVLARRLRGGGVRVALAAALLGPAILDPALDLANPLWRWSEGLQMYSTDSVALGRTGITPPLEEGLRWLRAHSDPDDVLAVDNHHAAARARQFIHSAYAERRVVLESWEYTPQAFSSDYARVVSGEVQPFPQRYELNREVFVDGSRRALDRMVEEHDVRWLVTNKGHGYTRTDLSDIADLAFENDAVAIYRTPS